MTKLSEIIESYSCSEITNNFVMQFGTLKDGVIGFPCVTKDKGIVEVSYFYGEAKLKNIIDISTQIGCPAQCSFCVLEKEQFIRNLSAKEIYEQAILMLKQAKQYGMDIDGIKHKVTIANTGEPLFNNEVVDALKLISDLSVSFKISTIFPAAKKCKQNFEKIASFASNYAEPVQIQVSLLSTDENQRNQIAGIPVASFKELRNAADYWRNINPNGRKINLTFTLTNDTCCCVDDVYQLFPPELFKFRFRPCIVTTNAKENGLLGIDTTKFERIRTDFQEKGYEISNLEVSTPTEKIFGIAGNTMRKKYIEMLQSGIEGTVK